MSYLDDFQQFAATCRADPAFIMVIEDAFRRSGLGDIIGWTPPPTAVEGPPPPFPAAGDITAVQTSVFDNWPTGRPEKGVPSRYGVAVEVWTVAAEKIVVAKGKKPNFQFKAQAALMDATNLKRQIADLRRKKRRAPLDPDYLDFLDQMADGIQASDVHIAMVNTNVADDRSGYDRGRYYHPYQFLIVSLQDGVVDFAKLILGEDVIELPPFAGRDAGGNPLARNVVAQSRHDRCGMIQSSWATNEH